MKIGLINKIDVFSGNAYEHRKMDSMKTNYLDSGKIFYVGQVQ